MDAIVLVKQVPDVSNIPEEAWDREHGTLRRAMDPVDTIKRQLEHAPNLKTALTRVRDLFGARAIDPQNIMLLKGTELLNQAKAAGKENQ